MSLFIFRALVLGWNNLPQGLRKILKAIGIPQFLSSIWFPYKDLPVPPTEKPVRDLVSAIVQPGWLCADVGGNFGLITEVIAEKVGFTGKVIAFEAHPLNASILHKRMELKKLRNVAVENKAVSDGKEKSLWLYAGRRSSPNEWNITGKDVSGKQTKAEIEIPAVSLDEYFQGKRLNFVKVDVEGAEIQVLAVMPQLLKIARPVMIIEFHNPTAWESRHLLFDAGYRIFTLNGKEVAPSDALVYHVCAFPSEQPPQPEIFPAIK